MSKRPRKDDTISRQIKKRITEREIDQNCDMKLKSIHEKTVQMLFAGARASTKGVDGNQNIEKPVEKICSVCHSIADSTCWNCTLYLCCCCRQHCSKCCEYFCYDCCKNRDLEPTCANCI